MIPDMKPIIEVYQQQVNDFYEGEVMKAVHKMYVNVDKDRLVKAITDARAFYEEGYRAAINEIRAQQELESKLRVLESSDMFDEDGGEITHCETVTNRNGLKNEPLTLDELRKMDAPVWLRCYQVDGDGYWCLCKNGIIITPAGNRYDVSEIPHWAFYLQKPEEVYDG